MRKNLTVLFLAGAIGAALVAASAQNNSAAFTQAEKDIVTACEVNLSTAALSPIVAKNCLAKLNANDQALLKKLESANRPRLLNLLAETNAIVNLNDIIYRNSPESMKALYGYADKNACSSMLADKLAGLTSPVYRILGLSPDSILRWTDRYAKDQYDHVRHAVRPWDSLDTARKNFLSSYKIDEGKWMDTDLRTRIDSLRFWASTVGTAILNIPAGSVDGGTLRAMIDATLAIEEDISPELFSRLSEHIKLSKEKLKQSVAPQDKKEIERLKNFISSLQNTATGDQLAALKSLFDNAKTAKGNPAPPVSQKQEPAKPGLLSSRQASQIAQMLGPAFTKEIKGTRAGNAVLSFYSGKEYKSTGFTKLNLGITPVGANIAGQWSASQKEIVFSKSIVEDWMAANKYSAKDVLTQKEPLKKLARYLAPTFVHEATHQKQTAWAAQNGIPHPYQHDDEAETFSMAALFTLEKAKQEYSAGNKTYIKEVPPGQVERAAIIKDYGVDGLRRYLTPAYSFIPSAEGSAAEQIFKAEFAEAILAERAGNNRVPEFFHDQLRQDWPKRKVFTNPKSNQPTRYTVPKQAKENIAAYQQAFYLPAYKSKVLEEISDIDLKAYKLYTAKRAADEELICDWRAQILAEPLQPQPAAAAVPPPAAN